MFSFANKLTHVVFLCFILKDALGFTQKKQNKTKQKQNKTKQNKNKNKKTKQKQNKKKQRQKNKKQNKTKQNKAKKNIKGNISCLMFHLQLRKKRSCFMPGNKMMTPQKL